MMPIISSFSDWRLAQNVPEMLPPTIRAVRHLISFLQWRFSLLPVGAFHWAPEDNAEPDGQQSQIYIAGDTPIPAQAVGMRPAITVLRSQAAFQGIGLGDVVDHNLRTGGKSYMDLVPTTLCVNVLSRLPMVAERLAWFVQDQIFTLREEIVRTEKCILSLGARTTLGAPSPAGALVDSVDHDWCVVPLFLPTYLQHRTSFVPLNQPVLKSIKVISKEEAASLTKKPAS